MKDPLKIIEDAQAQGEPFLVLRAKDAFAIDALTAYLIRCRDHVEEETLSEEEYERFKVFTQDFLEIEHAFLQWRRSNKDKIKFPD
jgi:hypothetical protein